MGAMTDGTTGTETTRTMGDGGEVEGTRDEPRGIALRILRARVGAATRKLRGLASEMDRRMEVERAHGARGLASWHMYDAPLTMPNGVPYGTEVQELAGAITDEAALATELVNELPADERDRYLTRITEATTEVRRG